MRYFITSILSGSMFGVYSMSKHGMEAFTDSLAAEQGFHKRPCTPCSMKIPSVVTWSFPTRARNTATAKRSWSKCWKSRWRRTLDPTRMRAYVVGEPGY